MKRRDFLTMVSGSGAAVFARKALATAWNATSAERRIGYIRPQIPAAAIPAYKGTHYVDHVPDTLDIAERARLALNAITSITDPDADYEIFFHFRVFSDPPAMEHYFSDWCQESEGFVEVLPLMRLMTGDGMNSEVDRAWTDVILKSIGPDGLFYFPTEGRPWFYHETHRDVHPAADPDDHVDMKNFVSTILLANNSTASTADFSAYTQFTHPQPAARLLGALTIYGLRDKDPVWKQATEQPMIDRWAELAVYKDDYAYWPRVMYAPGAKAAPELPMPVGIWSVETSGRFVQGLAQ
jgi:hypothetical protein